MTTLVLTLVFGRAGTAGAPDFDRRVAPILIRRCIDCHSGIDPKGGLDLTRRATAMRGGASGEVIAAGKPEESLLWEHVHDGTMPPRTKLSEEEKKVLHDWIRSGAGWGSDPIDTFRLTTERRAGRDWWSLQRLSRPELPSVGDESWCANPIDAFILHRLEAAGLPPAPPADRRTLIRRLSYDLLGLPPTPEEVEAFLGDDRADAYERLVDRLLASPQYGVRWGRLWLDLARYGESHGFEHDEFRPDAWPYRDWVVRALNGDVPYDEFARLQLAGDVLRPEDPRAVEATGFLVAGAFDSVGQAQQSEAMRRVVRQDELEDLVGTVGQTFLGLTVHCARCHDHKFDPIGQVEYYRMAAALAGVRHGVRDVAPLAPEVRAVRRRLAELTARLAQIEAPVRKLLSEQAGTSTAEQAPAPIARWDFDRDERDHAGGLHALLEGQTRLVREGLKVDVKAGSVAATTPALATDLEAKTLEAWVRLDELKQPGGVILGVQDLDGKAFDALVFTERESGNWSAGSNDPARTRRFDGPREAEAQGRPVHLALAYADDGTIAAYREGVPYGKPFRSAGPATFRAGSAQVVFGLRQGLPGVRTMLGGVIVRARLYDRALTAAEIAASAASAGDDVPEASIDEELSPTLRAERARLRGEIDDLWASLTATVRKVYTVTPRPPEVVHRLTRGNPAQPAEVVSAGGLGSVAGPESEFGLAPDAPEALRRARLAAWITDPRNPIFPRVIVNRLWQVHFGAGLVETSSDFGFQGGKPSHPELMEWLACELAAAGFRLKSVHRLIATSATYRQSSRTHPGAMRVDASNRLLWRKAPLRLEAESVRDAMLAVAGVLDPRLEGPGFREFAVTNAPGTLTNQYTPVVAVGPEFARRTLYRTWARGGRSGFLDALDCPDPSTTAPRRAVTTTPLQALALLNNALVLDLADRLSARLSREVGDDPERQVDRAYQLCFGREPDSDEREDARAVVEAHGPSVLARALFNSNEFLYVD
jgi:hypothetical protein